MSDALVRTAAGIDGYPDLAQVNFMLAELAKEPPSQVRTEMTDGLLEMRTLLAGGTPVGDDTGGLGSLPIAG